MAYSTPSLNTTLDQPPALREKVEKKAPDDFDSKTRRKRRSSFPHPRRCSSSFEIEPEAVFIKVDLFLCELEHRLDWLEQYGSNLRLAAVDAPINRAYSTLAAVRQACSTVSGDLMDAGRRRARVLVEELEKRYNGVLTTRETLEARASAALRLMEALLAEYEAIAPLVCGGGSGDDSSSGGYSDVSDGVSARLYGAVDTGWKRAEEGFRNAREAVDDGLSNAARHAKDALRASIDRAIRGAREARDGLITYDVLPEPWRVNPHIVRGYRFSTSYRECLTSAFWISNETVNIWSHAVGLVVVLVIAAQFFLNHGHRYDDDGTGTYSAAATTDAVFAAVFFFAACKCLACSTIWHTMSSIADQTLLERFACIDYTGISLLIAASIITTEYAAFYCEPATRYAYIVATGVLGLAGTIVPWHPFFNRADMSWLRVAFYVALAATGFAPVVQLNLTRGPVWSYAFYAPIMKSIAVYLVGALVYAARVPEKFVPGWFDYVGGSHNIWHFAVLGGILFHYAAMHEMFATAFERARTECLTALA